MISSGWMLKVFERFKRPRQLNENCRGMNDRRWRLKVFKDEGESIGCWTVTNLIGVGTTKFRVSEFISECSDAGASGNSPDIATRFWVRMVSQCKPK